MEYPATTWLFGGTSIYASSIYFFARSQKIPIKPFCSPHAKWPICRTWDRINLEDRQSVAQILSCDPPSVLIFGGGFCNVAKCEAHPEYAQKRNVESLKHLLEHVPSQTRIVYLSSDHVFGGGLGPYNEQSTPHPISVYGMSKLRAESLICDARPDALIIRTGLVIGPSVSGRHGHLDWLRYRAKNSLPLTIISGEFRSAVPAQHYAQRIFELVAMKASGVQHIVARRAIERPQLANDLIAHFGMSASVDTAHRTTLLTPHLGDVSLTTMTQSNMCQVDLWSPECS